MVMRLVFFGTPEFAVPTLGEIVRSSPHRVVGAVSQPDRPHGRGQRVRETPVKSAARALDIPVLQPERLKNDAFLDHLRALLPDLGVVVAYGRILPREVLELPRLGLLNVHASLLPKYRGAAPVQRAVMAGEEVTGVTIMRVVAALDAGPILDAERRAIGPDETSDEIERDLAVRGARLLVPTLDRVARGEARETPQDEGLATYAPRLTKDEGSIDWSRPAQEIHDKVRGLHPWPHASTALAGARYLILRTRPEPHRREAAPPGTITEARGDVFDVAAGTGAVRILELQPEGRRPMTAREFLAGHGLQPGVRFHSAPQA